MDPTLSLPIFGTVAAATICCPDRGAMEGACAEGFYRFTRWERWSTDPLLGAIGPNPTAGATDPDAAFGALRTYARTNGFGGVELVNVFALVGSDAFVTLRTKAREFGDGTRNQTHIRALLDHAQTVVLAYGDALQGARVRPGLSFVRSCIEAPSHAKPMCFGYTDAGMPITLLDLPPRPRLRDFFFSDK